MKSSIELIVGISYIALMVGIAIGDVGKICPAAKYDWWLPVVVAVAFSFPFILGIMAGKKSND